MADPEHCSILNPKSNDVFNINDTVNVHYKISITLFYGIGNWDMALMCGDRSYSGEMGESLIITLLSRNCSSASPAHLL